LVDKHENKQEYGLLFPGNGIVSTSSALIGFKDYLNVNKKYLLNFSGARNGPYGELLNKNTLNSFMEWLDKRKISYIVIRNSQLGPYSNYFQKLTNNSNFELEYIDNFSSVYTYKNNRNINDFV
jgi:hypothetical protein